MWDCKFDSSVKTQIVDVNFGLVENGKTCGKIVKFVNKTSVSKLNFFFYEKSLLKLNFLIQLIFLFLDGTIICGSKRFFN